MLDIMRRGSKHIVVKALLIMLALAFVTWGVGDVFRGRISNAVAEVNGESISISAFQNAYQNQVKRYEQNFGQALSVEQIRRLNVKSMVLNQLVNSSLIEQRVVDLNFIISDAALRDYVVGLGVFNDESGEFSKERFRTLLRASGVTENEYSASVKKGMAVDMFRNTLASGSFYSKDLAEIIYKYRNARRKVDLLKIPASYVKNVGHPIDADLVQYYQDHSREFLVPEIRAASYVVFSPKDVLGEVKVSDEEVKRVYEERIDMYIKPHMRDVVQYLFDSEKAASDAHGKLVAGDVDGIGGLPMGEVSREGLFSDVSDAVFSLALNTYSEPVKSSMGWHIFYVKGEKKDMRVPFDSVKLGLREELAFDRQESMLYDVTNELEDDLASGLSLEEVAKKYAFVVRKVKGVDRSGNDAKGNKDRAVPDDDTFLSLLFQTDLNVESPMTLLANKGKYVIMRVTNIKSERVKALDEVRGSVINLWKKSEKEKKLRKLADEKATDARSGKELKAIANEGGFVYRPGKSISRPSAEEFADTYKGVPPQLTYELFRLRVGESSKAYEADDGSYVIGKVREVIDAKSTNGSVDKVIEGMRAGLAEDLLRQYFVFLRSDADVTIYYNAVDAAF